MMEMLLRDLSESRVDEAEEKHTAVSFPHSRGASSMEDKEWDLCAVDYLFPY